MLTPMNNYDLLIQKLDHFIRRYYTNQMIRGALYSLGFILVLFLMVALLEHYNFFGMGMRKFLWFGFLGASLLALGGWVILPMLRYFRLGKTISHERAATIIGSHFTDVKDKLLNILQLRDQANQADHKELLLASIDQKSESIKLVPFKQAIDFSKNRKYLRYALPPLLLLLILLMAAPNMIRESTNRLIHNNEDFKRPLPFDFVLSDEKPSVVQFEDYPLEVSIEGEKLPAEVFIEVDNYQYRMQKDAANKFSYRFSNVQKETDFRLYSGPVSSKEYTLDVLKKPNIAGFEVKLNYPNYTGRKDESLSSIGDLVVPAGTQLDWVFNAEHTDEIQLAFSDQEKREAATRFSDDLFTFKRRVMRDLGYRMYVSNKDLPNADSISYTISVVPDLYPSISAEKFVDSTDSKLLYFLGEASDDYGLTRLTFNYQVKNVDGQQQPLESLPLGLDKGKQTSYDHVFDVSELALKPGDEVTYYFEVFDNDGVNGAKSARTNLDLFSVPTEEELEELKQENEEKVKRELREALEENKEVQKELKKVRDRILQQKEMDWQSRKELEKLLDRQKELQEKIENAKEAFEENMRNEEEFSETEESIQEKQEQLQELFEEVMDEEMRELMEQIEELMQELEKDEALEMMEEMEFNDEEMEKELDRLQELYKQLELEKEMMETIDKLKELAKQQEELAEKTEKQEESQEELMEEQQEIEEEMEKIEEKMEEMQEMNQELEKPQDMPDRQEQTDEIQEDIQKSQEQMEQQDNKGASGSQKGASDKMKDMAEAMEMQMEGQQMEQMEEDMQALRQLLENLVGLSFNQEGLIDELDVTTINTPRYVELVQNQFKLEDDFRLIEDSLQALSKRVFQLESFVTEKVSEINRGMASSIDELEERRKPEAAAHQQHVFKNVNDLALMLSETMNQMQQQMSGMMAGAQMCNKPGGQGQGKSGNVPKDKMSEGQEGLNEDMKGMKDKAGKNGKQPSSKEFAEMAARQAALRKALEKKNKEMKEQGRGSSELQELIDEMNKQEIDLVNKRLTNEMMQRQEDILGRLLEHEKAERQREYDNQRKAERTFDKERKLPPSLEEYIKQREAEIDQYKSANPNLKPYYRFLVDEYFKSLKE